MYLKNLTVLGFKSFADKTSLNFQPGVMAIVGPNGCGKSNVSDSIRWVLGEQSAKALRGTEMADVIFNGTDGRKPLSMAEVSLTLGNVDHEHLKAAGVELTYDEVTVTRRVFRDGGSEYFINRTPCRLRDIQQLFMGTGMGRASYSIMAQGHITQILSSKPDDRRLIFEEAAGITKFKAQKKEALRKLEYTEQNLLRVADLVREVKRQIGSLQRQAGKARRYKQISQELQFLETQLARHQFDVLQTDIRERQQKAARLREEIESGTTGIQQAEHEIATLREQLIALEHEASLKQQHGLELKGEAERHENRIQFNERRLVELETQNAAALGDIAQSEERQRASEAELAEVSQRLATSEASLAQQQEALQSRQEALREMEEEIRQRQEALRAAQSRAFATAQELSKLRNELNALDLQKQGNIVRIEKLASEQVQLEEERQRLETRLSEFAANVEAEKLSIQTKRGTVEERQQRLKQVQQDIARITQEVDALLRTQAEKRSRLNVLEQLDESHEGFSSGTLAALRQSQSVLGSLADRIRVPDRYVTAIENALGHNLQTVLTEKPEAAQQIITDLNTSKKGRASIAALEIKCPDAAQLVFPGDMSPAGNGEAQPAAPDTDSTVVHALSVVQAESSVDGLVRGLLGRTFIVSDLSTATANIQNGHAGCDFVTYDGELLNRHGIYTGGNQSNNGGSKPGSILGRKNQIAELQAVLAQLQEQINEASRQRGAMQSEITELQAGLQEAQTELRQQEVAIATRQGEFNALQNSRRMLYQKIETVAFEAESLSSQDNEGREKHSALVARCSELDAAQQAAQQAVAEISADLEGQRQQREAANAALTESRVGLATEQQIMASLRQRTQTLEQRLTELARITRQRQDEISACIERRAQAQAENADSRSRITTLQKEREETSVQITDILQRKQACEADVARRDEALRELRRNVGDQQQQRSTVEIELAQKEMSIQNLRERIQQKYHLVLDDIRSECITITLADEGAPKVQTLSPEDMAQAGLATDWDAISGQVTALQTRIDEMGPVNLVAIEEYEETEQRYQFLSQQHNDLETAKVQLLEVITRINTQTREMFLQTFTQIRQNFQVMFTEVFGGGKADLRLVDENDVLESGIEIVARPPGKQLQSITLLSGGEQTMTAVSLLFSIYQVKPSPFCVLDELDAPLDESNINRFLRILKRFLEHSQFIIITHNKRTMGMADVLYGVTMQEQGVSKIVSVKFHKTDDQVTDHKPQSIETPIEGPKVEDAEDKLQPKSETVEIS
jgi:chromosome segregation protein